MTLSPPPAAAIDAVVAAALDEDLGAPGDITSDAIFAPGDLLRGVIVARSPGRLSGIAVAGAVFVAVDPDVTYDVAVADGGDIAAGDVLARVWGPARAILAAERSALNILGRLSGIATATAELVAAVAGTGATILDTRKTAPGLRALDKYAVRCGGGANHRMGLFDVAMIKDNHIAAAGSLTAAVARVRRAVGPDVTVVVEVETEAQLTEVVGLPVNRVLLDNMTPDQLRAAVALVGGMETEASGGITLETAPAVAESGVDYLSVGWITHSAPALDVALDVRG